MRPSDKTAQDMERLRTRTVRAEPTTLLGKPCIARSDLLMGHSPRRDHSSLWLCAKVAGYAVTSMAWAASGELWKERKKEGVPRETLGKSLGTP
jgi:hypothetical protein